VKKIINEWSKAFTTNEIKLKRLMINMKLQTPAEGILKKNDWGDAKTYHVVCDCGSEDHTHDLWIEAEDVGITVTIYATVKSPWWSMNRFKQIWTLLVKGYLEHQTVLTMNEQSALNYAETLKSAIKDVKDFKKP
jgi:hypothetical protein